MRRFVRILGWAVVLIVAVLAVARGAAVLREIDTLADIVPPEGRLVATDEGAIFIQEHGPETGPPVLFAHGTAAWSGLWQPVLKQMGEEGWRAIGFDMPPFGFSEHARDRDYSRGRQSDRVLALLKELDVQPVVVAHSVGAGPVVEAVMRDQAAFAGLIVVDGALALGGHERDTVLPLPLRSATLREAATSLTMTNPWLTGVFLRGFIHVKEAATSERIAVLKRPLVRKHSTAAYADWVPTLLVPPDDALSTRAENYQKLQLPVVYIWGEQDTVTPLEQAETLHSLTPGATLLTLQGVGHIPQIEDQEAFLLALREALGLIAQD